MYEKYNCNELDLCNPLQNIKNMIFKKDFFKHYLKHCSIQSKPGFDNEKG